MKLLRAIDEKYIHELTTDLFDMDFEDKGIVEFSKLDIEDAVEQLQKSKAVNNNLKYRRLMYED